MTTQDLIHLEDSIQKMEVTDQTSIVPQSDPRCSFDSIPSEVIEYNIFGYFWFQYWTKHFVSVCKRWKQICEHSTIVPKHLRISPKQSLDVGQAILWVKKYQPTILELNFENIQKSVHRCVIEELVGASECIDTLLLNFPQYFYGRPKPAKALSKIRTLVWRGGYTERIFEFFPSLQRLQMHFDNRDSVDATKIPVEDVTLIEPLDAETNLTNISVPKLTVIRGEKVLKKSDGKITVIQADDMTYKEYFRYFGKTKLYAQLSSQSFEAATRLLFEDGVSYEYEADLVKGDHRSYEYPTYQNCHDFNYDSVFEHKDYWNHSQKFPFSTKLPISDRVRFIHIVRIGDVDAAVDFLANIGKKIDIDVSIARAFFNLLLYPKFNANAFDDPNVREIAKMIVESDIDNGWKSLKTSEQFEKIADLVDWSKTYANTKDYDLFWAMIDKGAQMPCQVFLEVLLFYWFEEAGTACSEILKELIVRDPQIWYDILSIAPPNKALEVMKRFNIPLIIEKNGKALWHAWCKNGKLPSEDLYPTYINHMDSTGSTLLISVIESPVISSLEIVLKKGADPNKHHPRKLSPLATLLVATRASKDTNCINWLLSLFKAGADVNQSCMFEGRMCSPLMIAVLVGSPLPTISLLIALGARTDYCDDQGRSVVDCVVECENKYEASDYRTLKWRIKGSK